MKPEVSAMDRMAAIESSQVMSVHRRVTATRLGQRAGTSSQRRKRRACSGAPSHEHILSALTVEGLSIK